MFQWKEERKLLALKKLQAIIYTTEKLESLKILPFDVGIGSSEVGGPGWMGPKYWPRRSLVSPKSSHRSQFWADHLCPEAAAAAGFAELEVCTKGSF